MNRQKESLKKHIVNIENEVKNMRTMIAKMAAIIAFAGSLLFTGAAGVNPAKAADNNEPLVISTQKTVKFNANSGSAFMKKHPKIAKYFNKAVNDLVGVDYEPIAYMGSSKDSSGKNYYVFSRMTVVYPDAEPEFAVVTIQKDKKGKVKMGDIEKIVPGASADEKSEGVQIPDPFEEFTDKKAAETAAGFTITLPEDKDSSANVIYRVDSDSKMLEIIYYSDSDKTEELYRIRKAIGNDDISGDYNNYNETKEIKSDGRTVTLKGNDGRVSVAVWTDDKYTYAVDYSGQGASSDAISALVGAIR